MTTDEQQRLRLHQSLERQIGEDMAGVLMSSLPPFDWNQVATKDDLKVFATRDEMNLKFGDMNLRFADMNVKFAEVNATTEVGLANLRTEIASHQEKNVSAIKGLQAEFQKSLRINTATIMTLLVGCFGVLFSRI